MGAYVPARQVLQDADDVALGVGDQKPGLHWMHCEASVAAMVDDHSPALQARHWLNKEAAETEDQDPALQVTHAEARGPE